MTSNSNSSNENPMNANRREREKEEKDRREAMHMHHPQIHHHGGGPELMDAEDSLLEMRSSMTNKFERNEIAAEKLADKDFYRDFGDIFDPDLKK